MLAPKMLAHNNVMNHFMESSCHSFAELPKRSKSYNMLSLSPKSKVVIQKEVVPKKPVPKKLKTNKDDDLIIYSLNTKSEN